MPPLSKRRAEAVASPAPRSVRQRRERDSDVSDAASGYDYNSENGEDVSGGLQDQMVKNLVRLALACEYTRQPLRRADITAKVLAPNGARAFRTVFAAAQTRLQNVFGMTMTELPGKEKVTMSQKRAAQKANGSSQNAPSSSRAYIVTSTLPALFRKPAILHPPKIPSITAEAGYTSFYTTIVSIILVCEGQRIGEGKLERYLKRFNADEYVLSGEKTENVLKRMERQGYIVKIKDREPGGEEIVDWVVGPRGKVEIGEKGAAGLVKTVYGKRDTELEELENRLEKSLGAGTFRRKTKTAGEEGDGEENDEESEGHQSANGQAGEEAADSDGDPGPSRRSNANGRNGREQGRRARVSEPITPRRSRRRSSGFVDDEAEGEEDEDEEPDEDELEDRDEDADDDEDDKD